jgi:hypothetical protein
LLGTTSALAHLDMFTNLQLDRLAVENFVPEPSLLVGMAGENAAGIGTVMRQETVRRHAAAAGLRDSRSNRSRASSGAST